MCRHREDNMLKLTVDAAYIAWFSHSLKLSKELPNLLLPLRP